MQQYSDQELVSGILQGSPPHQLALYQHYSVPMFRVLLRFARDKSEAEDMLQDGFVRVFRDMSQFRGDGALGGWIRRIMVHTAINHYRKKAFQMERFGMEHLPEAPVAATAVDNLGEQELMALVAELPDGYRHVFNLYAIEGYDHAEIAAMLGCGESTSRSQLSKARSYLQARIERKDELHHAGRTSH